MSLTDIEHRIFDKLDRMSEKINDICKWKEQMSAQWKNHIDDIKEENERKNKRVYMILGVMAGAVSIIEVVRSIF